MNTESVECRKVADYEAQECPGDFYFKRIEGMDGDTHLHIILPGSTFICIGVSSYKDGSPARPKVWHWDGNEDRPTLTPSINCIEHWHGFLKAGRLVSC